MERSKLHFRHIMLFHFDQKKTAAESHRILCETYGECAPSKSMCEKWFQCFKDGDFNMEEKRSGAPKKFEDAELEALLHENPAQTLKELATTLDVSQTCVSKRLKAMGKSQEDGKWLPE